MPYDEEVQHFASIYSSESGLSGSQSASNAEIEIITLAQYSSSFSTCVDVCSIPNSVVCISIRSYYNDGFIALIKSNKFVTSYLKALRTPPQLDHNAFSGTADFIKTFVGLWKIIDVNSPGLNDRYADTLRAVIRLIKDLRLQFILDKGEMARKMKGIRRLRVCQLI